MAQDLQLEPIDFFAYLIRNFDDIFWERMPGGESLKKDVRAEAKRAGVISQTIDAKISQF